jgi:hypothetical protein
VSLWRREGVFLEHTSAQTGAHATGMRRSFALDPDISTTRMRSNSIHVSMHCRRCRCGDPACELMLLCPLILSSRPGLLSLISEPSSPSLVPLLERSRWLCIEAARLLFPRCT